MEKCCFPKLEATVKLSDLSVIVDEPVEPPEIGDVLMAIDKDISFIIKFRVTGIDRDFNEPLNIDLDISNIIRYDTNFQNINHSIDLTDKITTNNPYDIDGNIIGNNGTKINMNSIIDGDHINVLYRLNQSFSQITETGELIQLRVEEQNQSFAELKITSDLISSHVQDISDVNRLVYSEITQTARNIKAVIVEGEDGSSVELSKDAFKVAFLKSSADITTIDEFGITASNIDGSYTRMGAKGLEHIDGVGSKPYHYLTYTHVYEHLAGNGKEYQPHNFSLPSMFQNIENPDENISISVAIAKVYDSTDGDESVQYWSGCYGTIENGQIILNVMSTWRDYTYASGETGHWVDEFSEPREGYLNVQVTLVA